MLARTRFHPFSLPLDLASPLPLLPPGHHPRLPPRHGLCSWSLDPFPAGCSAFAARTPCCYSAHDPRHRLLTLRLLGTSATLQGEWGCPTANLEEIQEGESPSRYGIMLRLSRAPFSAARPQPRARAKGQSPQEAQARSDHRARKDCAISRRPCEWFWIFGWVDFSEWS